MKSSQQAVIAVGTKVYTRKMVALTLGLLALSALAARVEATIIEKVVNVQFGMGTSGGGVNLDGTAWGPTVSPLAYPAGANKWTDDSPGPGASGGRFVSFSSSPGLPDSNNNPSGIGFQFLGAIGTGNWSGVQPATLQLLQSSLIETPSDTLRINGLDNSRRYDIYLACYQSTGNKTTFTINGNPQTVTQANLASWTLGSNYAEFTDLAPSGGKIDIGIALVSGGYWSLDGFQIGLEAIPEPNTIILFGLGASTLWLRRRRQQAAA